MNKNRLMKLLQLSNQITGQIEKWRSQLESIKDEEDVARENTPESLQETDRYADSEAASDNMESALESLSEVVSVLQDIG